MEFVLLWPLSGIAAWAFMVWHYRIDLFHGFEVSFWLMLFPVCVAGPFSWLVPLIEPSRDL